MRDELCLCGPVTVAAAGKSCSLTKAHMRTGGSSEPPLGGSAPPLALLVLSSPPIINSPCLFSSSLKEKTHPQPLVDISVCVFLCVVLWARCAHLPPACFVRCTHVDEKKLYCHWKCRLEGEQIVLAKKLCLHQAHQRRLLFQMPWLLLLPLYDRFIPVRLLFCIGAKL